MNTETPATERTCRELSVVIPVFNESEVLPLLWKRLSVVLRSLPTRWNIVFVDDGSTDTSLPCLLALAEKERDVRVVSLSRNFGHQAAITAGLQHASGSVVVVMDADLQDPPELIPNMLQMYMQGYDVVYAQRRQRRGESVFKKVTARLFYRLLRWLAGHHFPPDAGDFRLMSRKVVAVLNAMPEAHRYVRGMAAWTGFRQTGVPFDRETRAAGRSKYGLLGMVRFAWTAIASFSAFPVRMGLPIGLFLLAVSVLYGLRVLYVRFWLNIAVPGWTSIVLLQLVFSAVTFFYLGILGDYVGRIYEEGKRRPLYVVKLTKNVDDAPREA